MNEDDLTIQEIELIALKPLADAAAARRRCRVEVHLTGIKTEEYTLYVIATRVPPHLRRKYLRRHGSNRYALFQRFSGPSRLYRFIGFAEMRDFLLEMGAE
jgi:hypothetical protein